jgi:hypothetical protein
MTRFKKFNRSLLHLFGKIIGVQDFSSANAETKPNRRKKYYFFFSFL